MHRAFRVAGAAGGVQDECWLILAMFGEGEVTFFKLHRRGKRADVNATVVSGDFSAGHGVVSEFNFALPIDEYNLFQPRRFGKHRLAKISLDDRQTRSAVAKNGTLLFRSEAHVIGTAMAPDEKIALNAATNSGESLSISATRSPSLTPSPDNIRATETV